MPKVLLVEDDNNLREIYQARLQAEGYDIVAARDGEEALVIAKKEQPDLVISDVMMPKISGFEMLDILRNTEGLKHVKVIMLTALGQAEDQSRADSLGADRYLVKSQVTLEDIVNAAKDLLASIGAPAADAATPAAAPAVEPVAAADAEPEAAASVEPPAPADDTPVIPLAAAPPETPEAALAIPLSMPPTPVSTLPDQTAPQVDEPATADVTPVAEPVPEVAPAEPATTPVSIPVTEPNDDAAVTPVADEPAADATPAVSSPAPEPTSAEPQTEAEETATVEQQIETFVHDQDGKPEPEATPIEVAIPVAPDVTSPETSPEQQKALDEAIASLNGGQETPAGAPAPVPSEAPASEYSTDTPTPVDAQDDVASSRKKVISPPSEAGTPKKSLNDLLAAEEAKETGAAPATPKAPDANSDFDPNSIAL